MEVPQPVPGRFPQPARVQTLDFLPLAAVLALVGLIALVTLAMTGPGATVPAPPPILIVARAPAPAAPGSRAPGAPAQGPVAVSRSAGQQLADLGRFRARANAGVPAFRVAGFYPLYDVAARTFGVNWLLLASVHAQETSFSMASGTYQGLNFAGCCGGPMQFNVTNRPRSTWNLVSDSYRYGPRPPVYPHSTTAHPSIYDDFDAMMAGARLLSSSGVGVALDATAWRGAYDYYGHDATGVLYADQVLARAISWSEHGFCAGCGLDASMVDAVHAAYGGPAQAALGRR